jgi:hypothetical protein
VGNCGGGGGWRKTTSQPIVASPLIDVIIYSSEKLNTLSEPVLPKA